MGNSKMILDKEIKIDGVDGVIHHHTIRIQLYSILERTIWGDALGYRRWKISEY